MAWSLWRVSLPTHDLAAAAHLYGTLLGLGAPIQIDDATLAFGDPLRGLRLQRPARVLQDAAGRLLGPVGARQVALAVDDLAQVVRNLDKAGLPAVPAPAGEFGTPAVHTLDPAQNLVAFCQRPPGTGRAGGADWVLHHVNLPAPDVRATVAFYVEIAGLREGRWQAPAARGDFSTDPAELAVLPLDAAEDNSGLHLIRPDPGFALRNGFAHNPSIGGHPAFCVPDVQAVQARLRAAGLAVSDAGVYAMRGMHQIYLQDPSANMLEVNQRV